MKASAVECRAPERFVYVTAAEAASYLRFDAAQDPARAFRQWAARERIPVCLRGRTSLWLIADLDEVVQRPRQARKQMEEAMHLRRSA